MEKKPLVAIVEDDAVLRSLIVRALVKAEYETAEYSQVMTAREGIAERRPDIVLLDLLLPDVPGWSLLNEIKDNKDLKSIPIIVISNLGSDVDIQRARGLGADAYLVKAQVTVSDIVSAVKTALGGPMPDVTPNGGVSLKDNKSEY